MTIKEILEKIRDNLASNETIRKYCQDNFGKRHKVVVGEVEQAPDEYTPSIVIFSVGTQERTSEIIKRQIAIGITVNKGEKEEIVDTKLTWNGFVLVHDFRELIEEQINEMQGLGKIEWNAQPQNGELYPLWAAVIFFTLEKRTTRRK